MRTFPYVSLARGSHRTVFLSVGTWRIATGKPCPARTGFPLLEGECAMRISARTFPILLSPMDLSLSSYTQHSGSDLFSVITIHLIRRKPLSISGDTIGGGSVSFAIPRTSDAFFHARMEARCTRKELRRRLATTKSLVFSLEPKSTNRHGSNGRTAALHLRTGHRFGIHAIPLRTRD